MLSSCVHGVKKPKKTHLFLVFTACLLTYLMPKLWNNDSNNVSFYNTVPQPKSGLLCKHKDINPAVVFVKLMECKGC